MELDRPSAWTEPRGLESAGQSPAPTLLKCRKQLGDANQMSLARVRRALGCDSYEGIVALVPEDFAKAIAQGGLFLKKDELMILARAFHVNMPFGPALDVRRFLEALGGEMPPDRRLKAERAWAVVDVEGKDGVPLGQVLSVFRASSHPRVKTRELAPDQASLLLANALRAQGASDGYCSRDHFLRCIAEFSACAPPACGETFDSVVVGGFQPEGSGIKSPEHVEALVFELAEKFERLSKKENIYRVVRQRFVQHDASCSGGLGAPEFRSLATSLGLNRSDGEIQQLFEYFASRCGGGRIEFDLFAAAMSRASEVQAPGRSLELGGTHAIVDRAATKPPSKLVPRLRQDLLTQHPGGLSPLFLAFRQLDRDDCGSVSHSEFVWGIRQCGLRLGSQEVESLLGTYDTNRDGRVSYGVFLDAVRGDLPTPAREAMVEAAWGRTAGGADEADAETVRAQYDPSAHPAVVDGRVAPRQKRADLDSYFGCGGDRPGRLSRTSFFRFLFDEAASIAEDSDFERYLAVAFP